MSSEASKRPAVEIREESPADADEVEALNELAFGGPVEATIVRELRASDGRLVSLVAFDASASSVVGHILFSSVTIDPPAGEFSAMGLAPMCVAPARQRQGIGTRLVESGLDACRRLGVASVVVLGHPEYYPRFGFRPAREFGLRCEYSVPDEAFMAIELVKGSLDGRSGGLVRYRPEFGAAAD